MYLIKDNTYYEFPKYTAISNFDLSARADTEDRAMQHGGVITGDGKINTRTVEIEISIVETNTVAEYRAVADEVKRYAYRKNQKLYIDDDRYVNLAGLKSITEEFEEGFYRVRGTLTLSFICTDPFVYSDSKNVQSIIVTSESTLTFNIVNQGNVDVPMIVTMNAMAVNTSVTLVNKTDNNRTFSYQDTGLTVGKTAIIDGVLGTVMRDGSSTINAMGGTFINLLPGNNVLSYNGAACAIKFEFAERWL